MVSKYNHFSFEQIVDICKKNKEAGKSIIFTHGVFDLFHYGHLYMLKESAKLGDILICGVQDDYHVKIAKGNDRPVIKEEHRLEIVQSLSCVDYAFVYKIENDENYVQMYNQLQPDVITIGRSHGREEQVLRYGELYGTKVVKIEKAFESTTGILARLPDNSKPKHI